MNEGEHRLYIDINDSVWSNKYLVTFESIGAQVILIYLKEIYSL